MQVLAVDVDLKAAPLAAVRAPAEKPISISPWFPSVGENHPQSPDGGFHFNSSPQIFHYEGPKEYWIFHPQSSVQLWSCIVSVEPFPRILRDSETDSIDSCYIIRNIPTSYHRTLEKDERLVNQTNNTAATICNNIRYKKKVPIEDEN